MNSIVKYRLFGLCTCLLVILGYAGEIPKLPTDNKTYAQSVSYVDSVRLKLKMDYQAGKIKLDSVGRVYADLMVNRIFPYWMGTEWDFNGYTAVPKEGKVACGYFVSTTMKHSGVVLNRFKMAQKSASEAALYLEKKDSLDRYLITRDSFVKVFMKKSKDGLYKVGLSYHVGFLYKSGSNLYFIHSNYINSEGVISEDASTSLALSSSGVYLVSDISNNKELMRKWLMGIELTMLTK
ncbi:MAG TPA: hypothetical protein VGF79_00455 [Bacteroidia bacterium]